MIPISDSPTRRGGFPVVNFLLIAVNVFVFFGLEMAQPNERALQQFITANGLVPQEIVAGRDLPPFSPLGNVYLTLLSSMYLHAGLVHLGSNMLYLWVFGDNVEDALGSLPYLVFYTLAGVLAGLAHIALNLDSRIPSVGASGAIAGVLGGYLVLFPRAQIRTLLFLGPFIALPRISAFILIGFWFLLQLLNGIASLEVQTQQTRGVAFWAHIGGFVAGFVLIHLFPRKRAVFLGPPG